MIQKHKQQTLQPRCPSLKNNSFRTQQQTTSKTTS